MANSSSGGEELSLKDLYELTREHIIHEDNLVNSRLTWYLVIQSLLFTAYGVTLNVPPLAESHVPQVSVFENVNPWVGVAASILVFTSVLGARRAIFEMQKFWADQKKSEIENYPPIVCKTQCLKWLGDAEAYLFPIILSIIWLCIPYS